MHAMSKVIDRIPPADLQAYMERRITSAQLAVIAKSSAVYLRKIIKRPPIPPSRRNSKKALYKARQEFRKSIAHLPTKEIQARAHVSPATADRIKKRYGTRRPLPAAPEAVQ